MFEYSVSGVSCLLNSQHYSHRAFCRHLRLSPLRPLSPLIQQQIQKYLQSQLDFFPRLRVILSLLYILISIVILTLNIFQSIFPAWQWYNYVLGGGGGACINSIALVIELLVLKMQLAKEQPYTPFHLLFFILLSITSVIRLFFCLFYLCTSNATDLTFSSLLALVSISQLIYWGFKRQSLPQFLHYWQINIDNILQSEIIRTDYLTQQSLVQSIKDDFPYLIPFVNVENGQISITIEAFRRLHNISEDYQSGKSKPQQANREPLIQSEHEKQSEFVADETYSMQQLKRLYTVCGRLPLKKQVDFQKISLPDLARQLQDWLQQLLKEKRSYQQDILKELKVPEDIVLSYKSLNYNNRSEEVDQTIGIRLPSDSNSIFCSVQVYKRMWIHDHYDFYLRATLCCSNQTVYPIKRYSEFEQLHHRLKLLIKTIGKSLYIPELPQKHLLHWNQDQQADKRKLGLEKYLKRITNDYTLMQVEELKEEILCFLGIDTKTKLKPKIERQSFSKFQIQKGEINKVIVKNKYVVFYQFKMVREGTITHTFQKRYSEFEELHCVHLYSTKELQRWMHNIKITYNILEKPSKLFKSQADRHQKMRNYLQNLCKIPDIQRVYSVKVFFNLEHEEFENKSELSEIEAQSRISHSKVYELGQKNDDRQSNSSHFSKMLDDLGNENYD